MLSTSADLRARPAELDASIVELRLPLKALDVQASVQRSLDGIVYPVLTLPPEIMSNIFLHCLHLPNLDDQRRTGPTPIHAPLLLLQVCRAWREIALSTPHLWVFLHVDLDRLTERLPYPEIETIVADWFGRAGSCPLTLSLCCELRRTFANGIRGILHPLAQRLQSLYLGVSWHQFKDLADIGPFPILETLALSATTSQGQSRVPLKLFSTAPRLHQIFFTRFATPSMFVLPCEVFQISCDDLIAQECLDLLKALPFLQISTACVYDDNFDPEYITHHHLKTLRLHSGGSTRFLRSLRLPALQNLHLTSDITYHNGNDYFSTFLASTSLRRFRADHPIESLSVEWFAAAMLGLVDLELDLPGHQFLREFLGMLDRNRDGAFLPHLRTLVFRRRMFGLDASMLGALSSRCTAGDENLADLESFQQILYPMSASLADAFARDNAMSLVACRELVERGLAVLHVGPAGQNLV
ncbi:hypothetical protein B0H16DRAFT_1885602 [Mycena metata]|uniref:F-box domain-containing protein n=1 Tax=Mycena metata TaxID=1033252 RepID=A0AAD7NEJ8_9AGAR|nr:hypothetical protein B0H16DRAFT_1885602 [Mycena metata]